MEIKLAKNFLLFFLLLFSTFQAFTSDRELCYSIEDKITMKEDGNVYRFYNEQKNVIVITVFINNSWQYVYNNFLNKDYYNKAVSITANIFIPNQDGRNEMTTVIIKDEKFNILNNPCK